MRLLKCIIVFFAVSFCVISCYTGKEIQLKQELVKVLKIDTVTRFDMVQQKITLVTARGMEYTTFSSMNEIWVKGTTYIVFIQH
jgi:hypothetical protein